MNFAIMGNNKGEGKSGRAELIETIRAAGGKAFVFGMAGGHVSDWYDENTTAKFVGVKASRNNVNPLKEISSIFSIRKKIKENAIDTAVIYGIKNHAAMTIGAKLGGCKRVMCVVNGSGNLFRLKGLKGKLVQCMAFPMLRVAYRLSNHICFQNADDKQLLIQKRILEDSDKVFLTGGSGVNLDDFRKQTLIAEDKFLFLARITPTKGIKEYIQAARLVKAIHPRASFDIVGPLDGAVEGTDNLGLDAAVKEGVVTYHGATNDVPAWMGQCRYFVYPSYYPEGVPRCAIQAIATGRPIITCATPGCKETVKDGVNGFLVAPRDPAMLAEKMMWMIAHPAEVEKMAEESRRYAEEKFDVNAINRCILDKMVGYPQRPENNRTQEQST